MAGLGVFHVLENCSTWNNLAGWILRVAREKLFHVEQLCRPLQIIVYVHKIGMIYGVRSDVLRMQRRSFFDAKLVKENGSGQGATRGEGIQCNQEKRGVPRRETRTRGCQEKGKNIGEERQWLGGESARGRNLYELHHDWCNDGGGVGDR
ncbi:MAG TPA: hypothetical protein VIY99_16795 [Terracidiphilus sp.]